MISQNLNLAIPPAAPIFNNFSLLNQTAQPVDPGFTITGYENVFVQGNYAYAVGGGNPGFTLSIFDITDCSRPKVIGYLTTGSVPWVSGPPYYLNGSYNVWIDDKYLYVASSGSSYLYIVDVSNPFSPVNISRLLITNAPGSIYGIAYQAGYVYLATQNTGLVVVDVGGGAGGGTITAPVQTYQEGGGVKSFGVTISGSTLFTTQYTTSGFTIRQIKSWTLVGAGSVIVPSLLQSLQVTTSGEALGVAVYQNTAYVCVQATGINSIDLIDITNPSSMINISQIAGVNTFNSAFNATAISYGAGNTILYIPSGQNATSGGAIDAYDVTIRTAPVHLGQVVTNIPNSVFGNIKLSNGYIFCADYGPVSTNGNLDIFSQLNTSFNRII